MRLNKHLTHAVRGLSAGAVDWIEIKNWASLVTSLDKDALHIYAGLLLQLAASLFFRRGLASPWPLLVVLAPELGNEAYDLLFEVWPPQDRTRQWLMSVHDVLNTLAVPLVIWVLARRWRPGTNLPSDPV